MHNIRGALDAEPEAVRLIEDMSNHNTRSRMLEQLRQELAKVRGPAEPASYCITSSNYFISFVFKDNELLEDERIYLDGLRHAPYT